ncbi:hypothetical protein IW261DRAFT_1423932 [Armillaria novae-zelandiae]|uniref:Uncharacterized protein n=1 Tax=Armillaria novae-zelandiae TaxID=153914 RepID=A0AA39NW24_9AGAR|nr:hypothetical protein IW261DRAFT_1423932 [Armillaria novae-zelandiae]
MLSCLGWLVCFWVRTDDGLVGGTGFIGQTAFTGNIVTWMDDILALAVVWISPSRLSIVRKLPFLVSVLFLLLWALLLAERIYYFHGRTSPSGMDTESQQFWGQTILVTVLACSAVDVRCRRLLLLLLSGLAIVVATSIMHTAFWVHGSAPFWRDLTTIIQSGLSLIFADVAMAAIHLCGIYNIAYPGRFGVEVSSSPVIHLAETETHGRQLGLQCRTPPTGNLVHIGLQRFDSNASSSKVEDSTKVLPEDNLQVPVPLTGPGTIEPSSSKSLPAAAIAKESMRLYSPLRRTGSPYNAYIHDQPLIDDDPFLRWEPGRTMRCGYLSAQSFTFYVLMLFEKELTS